MSAFKKTFIALFVAVLALSGAAARADTSITTANSSDNTETDSGDSTASNSAAVQAGHQGGGTSDVDASDIDNDNATNVQEGDNDIEGNQSAVSESGATVGGQIIGAQTSGDLTVDATNSSTDVDVESGDADSSNAFAAFAGLAAGTDTSVAADILNGDATNVQEGDNSADVNQATTAVTGDGVAGQILGATTTGTADIVLANTSDDTSATTGDSDEESDSSIFTGLTATGIIEVV
jgi:hypothetical protein